MLVWPPGKLAKVQLNVPVIGKVVGQVQLSALLAMLVILKPLGSWSVIVASTAAMELAFVTTIV